MTDHTTKPDPLPEMEELTPRRIVRELNRHIVGQEQAKRQVAIALRNRWRRMQVPQPLRDEIAPKNILMIGPTGVGKTEISRRLAKLANAPFIKVEATKFTEVGYVGRDVDSIIRDLLDMAVDATRAECADEVQDKARQLAEERVLNALLPGSKPEESADTREKLRSKLRRGDLDEKEIEIEISVTPVEEVQAPPGFEEMAAHFQNIVQSIGRDRRKKRRLAVADAMAMIVEEETDNLVDMNEVKDIAMEAVENNGIVFIDEMDKIADSDMRGGDVSRHGVQRDLLPLVEGTSVSTRFGHVHTDHILFIASGAFHYSSPSDLIPELQGRFPLRVELAALTIDDFKKILDGTDACLTRQYEALLQTEKVTLQFTVDGVARLAEIAWQVNDSGENIGARRLHTLIENLLEEVSFEADEMGGQTVVVDAQMVDEKLGVLSQNRERARYVL